MVLSQKTLPFLLSLLAGWIALNAQDTTFNIKGPLRDLNPSGHGFGLTAEVQSDSFYLRFGGFPIKQFPAHFQPADTAILAQYFTGIEGYYPNGVVVLVGNLKGPSPVFYPDRNGNLNFRDDGPPLRMDSATGQVTLYLGKENSFGVRYEKMDSVVKEEWAQQMEKFFKIDFYRNEGVPCLPYRHWLKRHRLSLRMDSLRWRGELYRLGRHDYNANGRFDDTLEDRWYFQPATIPFSRKRINGVRLLKTDSNWFVGGGQTYALTEVDRLGKKISIAPIEQVYEPPIRSGQSLPDIPYASLQGDSASLRDHLAEGKYLLLDFWGAWCMGCQHAAPRLQKIKAQYPDRLNILGINSGEPPKKVSSFLKKYEHDWPQGFANDRLLKTFLVEGYPGYVLINPAGKMLSLDVELFQVEQLLEGKSKLKSSKP